MISSGQREIHKKNYNREKRLKQLEILQKKTKDRMIRINKKTQEAKVLMQEIEPLYIDIYIQAYHRRGITIEEKMEIVKELQKYDCEKISEFFHKLNDCEKNSQIRITTFKHLQNIGKYVKLRKGFKGKRKVYMSERTNLR